MQITFASRSAPGRHNEDLVVAGPNWVAVLDGATPMPPEFDSGCIHSVPWLVRHLGAHLASRLGTGDERPLADLLAAAITATVADHADTCDMSNPDSPSATVTLVRETAGRVDYLVLCDSPLLLDRGEPEPTVCRDDQIDHLTDRTFAGVSKARNTDGGFWVAGTRPEAASHAVTGTVGTADLRHVAVLTDGGARLVERFGTMSWQQLLQLLITTGPEGLIDATRAAESRHTDVRGGKVHDDATAVLITL